MANAYEGVDIDWEYPGYAHLSRIRTEFDFLEPADSLKWKWRGLQANPEPRPGLGNRSIS